MNCVSRVYCRFFINSKMLVFSRLPHELQNVCLFSFELMTFQMLVLIVNTLKILNCQNSFIRNKLNYFEMQVLFFKF